MSNGALLTGWRQRWNRSLLRFLGQRARQNEIEDLAQETYLRLLRARDLTAVRNPQAYLLTVASHVLAEWRRRQPAQGVFEAVDENTPWETEGPELAMDAEISQMQLDAAIQALPAATRAVVLLRFRDGRRCAQIAGELGMSERQVRRHLTRGYERLRRAVDPG